MVTATAVKPLSIAPFEATPVEEIPVYHETLHKTFRSGRTKDIQFRLQQLRKFYWAVCDLEPLLELALHKDLRKGHHEAQITEIGWIKGECMDLINNLEDWAKDEPLHDVPAMFWPIRNRIRHEPLGVVLVIGAFNYPLQLSLLPFLGALAAGNTVILKPSENSPNSAMVMRMILDRLDPSCYVCVNGALPVSQALLECKYGKIVFTGGKTVGRIVAMKAAETLTPTLLELGGLNPAFITRSSNVELAAKRLLWGKVMNAGQVCISHNYVLIDRSLVSSFIAALHKQYRAFMPKGALESDYCRIVNKPSYDRIKSMVDESTGKIVLGGKMYEDELVIEPTVVLTENINDSMITRESFGPVWSIFPVDSLDRAIEVANQVDPTPLALFAFGNDAENEKILSSVTSGGASLNDSFGHSSSHHMPLGGVGESGNGAYHGYYSFKAFSHQRALATVPSWYDRLLRVRYMPYLPSELALLATLQRPSVNFDRNGNIVKGLGYWVALILRLGGSGVKGAILRWAFVAVLAVSLGVNRQSLGL